MRPTITQLLTEERAKQLKAIAPYREKAFEVLSTMRKERVDSRTVILIKSDKDKTEEINQFIAKLEKDRMNY